MYKSNSKVGWNFRPLITAKLTTMNTTYDFDDSYENCDEKNDVWSRGHVILNWECVEPTTTNKITNIVEMSNAVLDGSGARGFTASDGAD